MNQKQQPPRSALQILGELRKGNLIDELGFTLAGLTQDVIGSQKAATLTLKLTIKPSGVADNAVDIFDAISFKAPHVQPKPSMFFADAEGALTRNDPNQHEMTLDESDDGKVKKLTKSA